MSAPRRPRVLPEGCEKAAEVFADVTLGLHYVRWRGRRSDGWQVCQRRPDGTHGALVWLAPGARTLLETREAAARVIGQGIQAHAQALHPLAGYVHLRDTGGCGMPHFLCGAPFQFPYGGLNDVTCPACRALALNRLTAGAFGVREGHKEN